MDTPLEAVTRVLKADRLENGDGCRVKQPEYAGQSRLSDVRMLKEGTSRAALLCQGVHACEKTLDLNHTAHTWTYTDRLRCLDGHEAVVALLAADVAEGPVVRGVLGDVGDLVDRMVVQEDLEQGVEMFHNVQTCVELESNPDPGVTLNLKLTGQ